MPSANLILACAAGGGKTTRVVGQAVAEDGVRSALITYTRNNKKVIDDKLYEYLPVIPSHIEVMTWFTFLLRELARPYRRTLHSKRIEGLMWVEGRSVPYIPQSKTEPHYFTNNRYIYSDKISKFICECNKLSNGAVMRRLEQRFDHIMVDEVQDMSGYDLDVLELLLRTRTRVSLVGDHRQGTFRTNQAAKNSAFRGINIIKKFEDWHKTGLAELKREQYTHRCHQEIADVADGFFPNEPPTKSLNTAGTGHDGVFIVPTSRVAEYMHIYSPHVLRLDKKTTCQNLAATNFGESKGQTFQRTLIFPHGGAIKWLKTGDLKHIEKSIAKMYVGVTRARHSVGFVFDGDVAINGTKRFP